MNFANPDALTWLLGTPLLAAALVWYWLWKQRLKKTLGHLPMIEVMSDDVSARRQIASGVLMLTAIVLLILAWARPQWGLKDRVVQRSGVDVVFALDLSGSMLARDVTPSRLQAAKNEIDQTLAKLGGDRVGLVVFTAVSFAQTPLTTDYGAMRFYLRKLQPAQMPVGGTSLGGALGDALTLLSGGEGGEEEGQVSKAMRAKTRVAVLITDGEDHESDPMAMAARAKELGIKLVTVGFGSSKGERIPVYKENGLLAGYKRDRTGEVVLTKLDDKTLKEMADATGGLYIPYRGEHSVAYALIEYINSLEKSELEALMRQSYQERFGWPLGLALGLLLIAFVLGDRRRPGGKRVGQGGAPATAKALVSASSKALLLGVMCAQLAGCKALTERPMAQVEQGNAQVEAGEFDKAIASYQEAEALVPATPKLHYNLGLAHHGAGAAERAAEFFARALESDDVDLQFDALFNLGLSLAAKEEWRQAYETYQRALLLYAADPTRRTLPQYAQAIGNMELALYKLYPPCATLEDEHEQDDAPKEAGALEELQAQGLTLCGLDEDWFLLPVQVGTKVSLTSTFKSLREDPDPEHIFLPRQDDLHVSVWDASGTKELALDAGAGRPIPAKKSVDRSIETFIVTQDMLPEGAQNLLLKVWASDSREFKYDLQVKAIPPCAALEDALEENDRPTTAKNFQDIPTDKPLHLCPGDEDWFELEAQQGQTLFLDVQAQQDIEKEVPPQLSLEVQDQSGRVLATAVPDGGLVTAKLWQVPATGVLKVRVFGADGAQQGPYTLTHYLYGTCPEGNDRLEPNDLAAQAKDLPKEQPSQRYLRLCPEDQDHFKVSVEVAASAAKDPAAPAAGNSKHAPEKPKGLNLTMTLVPAPGQSPTDLAAASLQLLDATGDQVVSGAHMPDVPPNTPKDQAAQMQLGRALVKPDYDQPTALVRAIGPPLFYHLSSGNQGQSSQDQQDQKDEDQKQDDQKQNEDQESDQNKDDSQSDDAKKDGKQDQEEGEGGKEEDNPLEEEQGGEEDQESARPQKEEGKDPEMQRIDDILEALEQSDDNFQMRKALEKIPGRHIERDW